MKQLLKETIIVWIAIIVVLALIVTFIAVPFLIFAHAGTGEWKFIACILWLTFWPSLAIAFANIDDRKKVKDKM